MDPFLPRTKKPKPQRAPEHASQNHAPALQSRLNTTSQPQSESFGSLTGVTSKLEAQQKALTDKAEARQKALADKAEARIKAFSKAKGQDDVLTTKKRKNEGDAKEQPQEDSHKDGKDEAESLRMQELRRRFRAGERVFQPRKRGGNDAPVVTPTTQMLIAPATENESSPTSEEDEDEEEALANKHKRVADPRAETPVSAIPQTRPATTATRPGQFSKENPLRNIKNPNLIMHKKNKVLRMRQRSSGPWEASTFGRTLKSCVRPPRLLSTQSSKTQSGCRLRSKRKD